MTGLEQDHYEVVHNTIECVIESCGPWIFKPLFRMAEVIDDKNFVPESLNKYIKLTAESEDETVLLSILFIMAVEGRPN